MKTPKSMIFHFQIKDIVSQLQINVSREPISDPTLEITFSRVKTKILNPSQLHFLRKFRNVSYQTKYPYWN